MKREAVYYLFVLLLVVTLAACSNSEDPTAPTRYSDDELRHILDEAGMVVPLGEEHDTIVETTEEEEDGFRYTYETHDAIDNLESVMYLGLNDDIIWPGNIVRGDQAHQFVYEPIAVPRGPLTLSISLESSSIGGDLHEEVAEPNLHNIRQGISNIVSRVFVENTHVPAQVDYSYQQVHSMSQMSLFVGMDISCGVAELESAFNWDQYSETNKIMVKYQQVYYSIDMDTPVSPSALFAADASIDALATAMPTGSCPLYVSSVKYGMLAIMCIETTFTEEQMELALDAAYSGAVDVELEFGYTAHEVLNTSSIRIIVYGGSTQGIQEFDGYESFMNIIEASTEFSEESPGVPLLYKFRHVADNTLALITLTSQYTICRPMRIAQQVRVSSIRIVCEWSQDDDPFYDADVDMDRFYISANAFDCVDDNDPGTQINSVDESIFSWSTGSYVEMHAGSIFNAVGAITLTFDTENANWNCARLELAASGRDYDWMSGNEWATGSLVLLGNQMFGQHSIVMYGADFRMRAELLVEPLN